jgi:tRNA U34 5-carboxymethylaminomethyl modifying GTPase MnmE/TrmE
MLLDEELRLGSGALGGAAGQERTDELLGRIFSAFCVGK